MTGGPFYPPPPRGMDPSNRPPFGSNISDPKTNFWMAAAGMCNAIANLARTIDTQLKEDRDAGRAQEAEGSDGDGPGVT